MSYKEIGTKKLENNEMDESNHESEMNFIGFLLFENPLKKTTKKTIKEL